VGGKWDLRGRGIWRNAGSSSKATHKGEESSCAAAGKFSTLKSVKKNWPPDQFRETTEKTASRGVRRRRQSIRKEHFQLRGIGS